MPTGPEVSGAVGQERRRVPIVTRLATLALVAAAAAVVITATEQSHGPARARVAAETRPAFIVPNNQPTVVQILGAERTGDAILLRVDPAGNAGQQKLIVSPGARVTGMSLQAMLAAATDGRSTIHRLRYRLSYDADGAIVAITPAS